MKKTEGGKQKEGNRRRETERRKQKEGNRMKETTREKHEKPHKPTSIFGVGRCEAAHKYENGDFCKKINEK